ncbi:heavy-metal-associated domain-containing protein [Paramagnetospirillum magneticum]|uniref:Copper chaperone n=1 Tax=Paramagnetospirillum magneticum (strain ATCC 700264 / AMB-1) TaxID=342108 RepID=Q2W6B1_PARM1|nr:heavy-metal-associated domain-containing protein [Paramagnetospirillum magneticum]BAE50614.1 Copper chaperone [Paramagnetospirillum magneticum AMB-1]
MSATYRVTGMSCGGCSKSVTSAIQEITPGAKVEVNLEAKAVTVEGADEAQVRQAVDAAGFGFEGRV